VQGFQRRVPESLDRLSLPLHNTKALNDRLPRVKTTEFPKGIQCRADSTKTLPQTTRDYDQTGPRRKRA